MERFRNSNMRVKKSNATYGYNSVMDDVRSKLNKPQRITSEIIHEPIIESASNFLEHTIASPIAILFGAAFAFVGMILLYNYARFIGLALNGSEVFFLFLIGWVVGITFHLLKLLIYRH